MPTLLSLIQPSYTDKINHIRALAALWIFVFHYDQFVSHSFFAPLKSINIFELSVYHGYVCVYLFFVLSGFLLTQSYAKKFALKSYLTKRIGRIFPAYYLCIAVYILFFAHGNWDTSLFVAVFSFDLQVYPAPIGHLWFINRLLECYLFFPLLWWVLQKTGGKGLLLIYLLCLLAGGYWVLQDKPQLVMYYSSLVLCLSHFIVGMLLARQTNNSRPILSALIAALIFSMVLEWFHQASWQTPLGYTPLSILWLNTVGVLFAVLIRSYLSLAIYLPGFISVMLQKLGQISYSFYLYHFLVIHFFLRHRELLTAYKALNFIGLFLLCVITAVFFQWLLQMFSVWLTYSKQCFRRNLG